MNDVFSWPVGCAAEEESRADPARFAPVLTYAVSAALGGAITGGLVAAFGSALIAFHLPHVAIVIGAAALTSAAILLQISGRVSPLPERRAQVPRYWLLWRRTEATAAAFGAMIGSCALTYIEHSVVYVLGAVLVVVGRPELGLIAGLVYGGGRGFALVLTWTADRVGLSRPDWEALADRSVRANVMLSCVGATAFVATLAAGGA